MKTLATKQKADAKAPFVSFLLTEDNILIMRWKGFVKGDLIKEAHESVLKFIQEHEVNGIVEDVVDFTGPFSEVNEWFINYWVPKALKIGLKKAAVVMSKNIFTQLSVQDLQENPTFKELGLGYRIFGSLDDAVTWLKEKELINS